VRSSPYSPSGSRPRVVRRTHIAIHRLQPSSSRENSIHEYGISTLMFELYLRLFVQRHLTDVFKLWLSPWLHISNEKKEFT
jgi:hypothetical protein